MSFSLQSKPDFTWTKTVYLVISMEFYSSIEKNSGIELNTVLLIYIFQKVDSFFNSKLSLAVTGGVLLTALDLHHFHCRPEQSMSSTGSGLENPWIH